MNASKQLSRTSTEMVLTQNRSTRQQDNILHHIKQLYRQYTVHQSTRSCLLFWKRCNTQQSHLSRSSGPSIVPPKNRTQVRSEELSQGNKCVHQVWVKLRHIPFQVQWEHCPDTPYNIQAINITACFQCTLVFVAKLHSYITKISQQRKMELPTPWC